MADSDKKSYRLVPLRRAAWQWLLGQPSNDAMGYEDLAHVLHTTVSDVRTGIIYEMNRQNEVFLAEYGHPCWPGLISYSGKTFFWDREEGLQHRLTKADDALRERGLIPIDEFGERIAPLTIAPIKTLLQSNTGDTRLEKRALLIEQLGAEQHYALGWQREVWWINGEAAWDFPIYSCRRLRDELPISRKEVVRAIEAGEIEGRKPQFQGDKWVTSARLALAYLAAHRAKMREEKREEKKREVKDETPAPDPVLDPGEALRQHVRERQEIMAPVNEAVDYLAPVDASANGTEEIAEESVEVAAELPPLPPARISDAYLQVIIDDYIDKNVLSPYVTLPYVREMLDRIERAETWAAPLKPLG